MSSILRDGDDARTLRTARWYFGGLASAGAAACTHPLDLLKVHMQTHEKGKIGLVTQAAGIVRSGGIGALYNGLSASLMRQLTYSTVRFGIYETVKQRRGDAAPMKFYERICLAGMAGACGGVVGTPGDMINVRMQNDMKLPAESRRNYRHVFDGLARVLREEGFGKLFRGVGFASSRAVLMTIGQVAFYDQVKTMLLERGNFRDSIPLHFVASIIAGTIATTLTQPLDVLKTRAMNAKLGQYKGTKDVILDVAKLGPLAFFKGYVPAFVRLAPQTVITFIFFEQLRLNFGKDVNNYFSDDPVPS